MNNLQIELKRQKGKTYSEIFIDLYLKFKEKCFNVGMEDINEIIKLFEVWTKTCS